MSLHLDLRRGVHTVDPACSLASAARCMRDFGLKALLVTDPAIREVKGIITAEDLLEALAMGCDPWATVVGDFVHGDVPLLRCDEVTAAKVDRLRCRGYGFIALIDDGGLPVGLVPVEDLDVPVLRVAA